MPMDHDTVFGRFLRKGFRNCLKIIIRTDAFNHLLRANQRQILRQSADTTMADEEFLTGVVEPCALSDSSIELTTLFLIYPCIFQLASREQLEFFRTGRFTVRPVPR